MTISNMTLHLDQLQGDLLFSFVEGTETAANQKEKVMFLFCFFDKEGSRAAVATEIITLTIFT